MGNIESLLKNEIPSSSQKKKNKIQLVEKVEYYLSYLLCFPNVNVATLESKNQGKQCLSTTGKTGKQTRQWICVILRHLI